jgi:nicotinamidase-related amidase
MKVLIVVDMQKDFIDGSLGTPEAQAIVPNVVNKMKLHDSTNTLILFTKDTHTEGYLNTTEGIKLPVPHCIKGTEGWSIDRAIHDEFKKGNYLRYSTDKVINSRINKGTFGSYDLLEVLDNLDIDEIELCGVCTDICVISNAIMIKNFFPDVPVTVDASCCAGVTPEKHAAALEVMKSCQIDVIGE